AAAVTDSSNPALTATITYSLVVKIAITPGSLPAATVKSAYSVTLTATGGTSPYTWKLASGALPAGLSLSATTGKIAGTPTKAGTFTFTVLVTDSSHPALTATRTYALVVKIAITPASLPVATAGTAYSATLSAIGGTGPYTWKLASGALPAGLSLSGTTGRIAGTPATAGTFTFTVEVTDSSHPALTATRTFTIVVNP
ncbi:MAG TPA: Ig domain-containing protein, partial [Acidimicrobiales bacterium]|nr:Ig domain-containing protein [Acidimicrobiales bacterium]